jgi:hypothetical protein
MKSSLRLLAMAAFCAAVSLFSIGCTGVYAVSDDYDDDYDDDDYAYVSPGPVVVSPVVWGGAGFYGGTYYSTRNAYYSSSYYRNVNGAYYRGVNGHGAAYRTPWSNGGYYNGARGSASWHNGSGSASTYRGGSANWRQLEQRFRKREWLARRLRVVERRLRLVGRIARALRVMERWPWWPSMIGIGSRQRGALR